MSRTATTDRAEDGPDWHVAERSGPHGTGTEARVLDDAGFEAAATEIRSWPEYRPTPLLRLSGPARLADVASVWYKDESHRFGTGSFKALGGAYGVVRALERGSASRPDGRITVACATAGNHGAAVAWGARRVGARSVVFLPAGASEAREEALRALGAEVRRTGEGYDATVELASEMADREGWLVVSDTAMTSRPDRAASAVHVMQGYRLLVEEVLDELFASRQPTHVFVQAGVGGLAGAVCEHLRARLGSVRPEVIVVEAASAACLLSSARAGRKRILASSPRTSMIGLACRTPSALAWEILREGARGFLTVTDAEGRAAVRGLADGWSSSEGAADPPVVAGESGAAGLAGFLAAAGRPGPRRALGLDEGSRVLVVGTEGATDPDAYRRIVGRPAEEVAAARNGRVR